MDNKDDFLCTIVNWGVIVRADFETIQRIKKMLAGIPELDIIYQAVDTGRLRIVRENQGGMKK